ncbi:MAG: hypothetical protein ACI9ES_001118 [Oceanospirillaceae bacterium]|jgi:hypothetical protein
MCQQCYLDLPANPIISAPNAAPAIKVPTPLPSAALALVVLPRGWPCTTTSLLDYKLPTVFMTELKRSAAGIFNACAQLKQLIDRECQLTRL